MNDVRRQLRRAINRMSVREAKVWIRCFKLRPEEEEAIIACDVDKMSVVEASLKLNCCREVVSRRKTRGYDRIIRDLDGEIPS